ncbi:hypothetical protein FQR65_LT19737 [Abscondita terminalis]|nr:hypothetical protein FQR65_LT19737 [Abscondita terminalis]
MLKEMPAISAAAGPNTSSASNKNEELKEITSLLPLSSLDDLNSFEQLLSENNNSKHFDTIISHIGGKNPDVHVSNAIKYCFTLEL